MPVPALAVAAGLTSAFAVHRIVRSRRDGITVSRHVVPWPCEAKARVVHLTDVHVGPTTPRRDLARIAEVVRALAPDVVVMTGDYVNTSTFYLERLTTFVRDLPGPRLATLGNHDHWADAPKITRALEGVGVRVLVNESTAVDGAFGRLMVVGVDDGRSGHADVARAFRGVGRPDLTLVLTHFPSTADEIARHGARMVLAGHTHAGHIEPSMTSRYVARLAGNPYLHGFHRIGRSTDLYVSAGIGHSMAGLRAGRACPEIAVFDLDPGASLPASTRKTASWGRTSM